MSRDYAAVVVKAIEQGKLDHGIAQIREAVIKRSFLIETGREFPETVPPTSYKVGDIVVLNDHCGTRYLVGRRAMIKEKLRKNYRIELLDKHVTFRGSKTFRCPPTLFDKEEQIAEVQGS